jgi:hypothetical protein
MNNATVNIGEHGSLLYADFDFFGNIIRNSITGPYAGSILSFLRNLHTYFHSDGANLHSHSVSKCSFFHPSHLPQPLLLLIFSFLTGVRWNLSVALICIYWCLKMLSTFSMYTLAILRPVCSVYQPMYLSSYLFFWWLICCDLPIFWILIHYWMNGQRFSFIL